MITVFSSARTIDLYHLRLVFDTVSLVGQVNGPIAVPRALPGPLTSGRVSNAAAMVCWSFCAAKHPSTLKPWQKPELARKDPAGIVAKRKRQFSLVLLSGRHRITYVFAIMFLALTAILGARLGDWDEESPEPGKCYKTSFVTSPSALHPQADKAYVALSAAWLLSSMFSALFGSPKQRRVVLAVAFLQFPLHLYMMIALQVANHGALEGPESEGGWDFGQTTAVLLLGVTVNEFISKAWELWKWERGLKAEEVGGEGGEELQVRTQMEAPKAEGDAEVGEEFQRATG